jgi:hypothetical protein
MMHGFGDARALRGHPEVNPVVPGEPTYLAPEQIRGEAITRATDIFAASVVLWELLASRWLFGGVAEHERRYRLLQGAELTPPSTIAARLPRGLDDVVMKGLRANPADRYRTALEMAAAIERAVPEASQSVVSEWVLRTAVEALAQQTEMLKEIDVSPGAVQTILPEQPIDAEPAPAQGLDPPSDIDHTMAPRIVARPARSPAHDRRAVVIGIAGATIFAGVLAASHHAMRAGVFRPAPPPPIAPAGAALPIGTTVIIRNDSVVGGSAAAIDAAVTADAGAVAQPTRPAPPPPPLVPDDGPAPPPVLSRDTTLDPKAAEAAARALLRDRRLAHRGLIVKSGARRKTSAATEAVPSAPAGEEPADEAPADQ